MTLLAWDIAGDQGGWFRALWVPITGIVVATLMSIWDQVLTSNKICGKYWFFSIFQQSNRDSDALHRLTVELSCSSLHQTRENLDIEGVIKK